MDKLGIKKLYHTENRKEKEGFELSYHILVTNNETGKIELDKNNQVDIICIFGEKVGEWQLGVGGYYRTWNNEHRKIMMQVLVSEPVFLTAIQEAFDKPEAISANPKIERKIDANSNTQ